MLLFISEKLGRREIYSSRDKATISSLKSMYNTHKDFWTLRKLDWFQNVIKNRIDVDTKSQNDEQRSAES